MGYHSKDRNPSFHGLFQYTDDLKEMVIKIREQKRYEREFVLQDVMLKYYQCLKMSARLKTQAAYCRQIMAELFPAFCEGYFNTKKQKS